MLRHWQQDCIEQAIQTYSKGSRHFLCQATPGAGKTIMAAQLSKSLLHLNKIDIIVCFSPTATVAQSVQHTFKHVLEKDFSGKLGSVGQSFTYQSLQFLCENFWKNLSNQRVLAIFDEIHHCSGTNLENSNSWGEQIISKVQNSATYTLALTGTPWRSDKLPITLSSYSDPDGQIICDYQYTLRQALLDNVCRKPTITLIDNQYLQLTDSEEKKSYSSIKSFLSESKASYSTIIQNEDAMEYILNLGCNKLAEIRTLNPCAGGLVVASSVAHAFAIKKVLEHVLKQSCAIVSYHDAEAVHKIETFRSSKTQWIVSIGMISEGTDIPRLQVCCHLSNVKTELYFRQVLGRILRRTNEPNQEAWLYTFADEKLVRYAEEIEQDIPNSCLFLRDNSKVPTDDRADMGHHISCTNPRLENREVSLFWDNEPTASLPSDFGLTQPYQVKLSDFQQRVIKAFSEI